MKKSLVILMILFTVIAFSITTSYAEGDIKVVIDGHTLVFDVSPMTIQNRTMVPVRKIFESVGAMVDWDEANETITSTKNDQIIVMTIDSTEATVNGAPVTLDVPATVIDNRTLVPLRFISESLGLKVDWIEDSQLVQITTISNLNLTDNYYENKDGHFKIRMPEGWEITSTAYGEGSMNVDFQPIMNKTIWLSVLSQKNTDKLSFEQAEQNYFDGFVTNFTSQTNGAEINREKIKAGEQDSTWVELSGNSEGTDVRSYLLFTSNESYIQMAGFLANKQFFDQNADIIKECIQSFSPVI